MATRASTAITINNGVSLSTTVSQLSNLTQTNLGASTPSSWTAVVLELMVTNGSTAPTQGVPIVVNYAFSGQNVTIANMATSPVTLGFSTKGSFATSSNGVPSSIMLCNSGALAILGDYLYTWIEIPDNLMQPVTATLTATIAELVTGVTYST